MRGIEQQCFCCCLFAGLGQWGARPRCCPVCCRGREALPELVGGHMTMDRERTRGSETPRCTTVKWDDLSSYSHDVHAATVQQPAILISYSHFVLQPISSLRKVPIKKMMNQIYTGWLFQMLKCSPEQHTQVFSFSFFFFSFSQIQKDWTVHWLGLVHTEQVIHMWKHCIYLVPQLMR